MRRLPLILVAVSLALACSSRDSAPPSADASVAPVHAADVVFGRRALRTIEARLSGTGRVTLDGGAWSAALRTTAFGRVDQLQAVAVREQKTTTERVEYVHEGFVEWYVPDGRGIEQGFTIDTRPPGVGRVELEISVEGLAPKQQANGVTLGDEVRVDGLVVKDARGRTLPAELVLVDGKLRIRTDDTAATYPITIDPLYTPSEGKLLGTDLGASTWLGRSVAISGDTAVVGASKESYTCCAGVAYVFTRSGSTWTQQAKLLPTLGGDDQFGWSVAIDADTLAVGAPHYEYGGSANTGAVFIYTRSGTTWTLQQTLGASGGAGFGYSVALSGDRVLIGEPWRTSNTGGAYLFTRSAGTWSQTKYFSAGIYDEYAGTAVAIGDNYYAVGAPRNDVKAFNAGVVHIYQTSLDPWLDLYPDAVANQEFGTSLAARGNPLAVGAPGATGASAAYVFTHSTTSFGLARKLTGDYSFGCSVAINDTMVAVGERFFNFSGANGAGRVHVYNQAGWAEDATLSLSDRVTYDEFGTSVALTNDTIVIGGASRDEKGTDSGGAYVYRVIPEKITGAACTISDECATKFCVDGVCCDTACTGKCQACSAARKGSGSSGTCGSTADGGTPRTGECAAASCSSSTLTGAQVCDGAGACKAGPVTSCGLYACEATTAACRTTCTDSTHCSPAGWCDAGVCKADLDNGAACTSGAQCKTNNCVDGVCCDTACTGKCQACSAAKKGSGVSGTCEAVAADSDPDNDCAPGTDPCGLPGTCDGLGACRLYAKSGTVCGTTSCVDGKVTGKVCNGAGACGDATGVSCGAYACMTTACATSCTEGTAATDCATNAYCTTTGTCALKKSNGTACTSGKECTSSFCVDGVCCSSTCTGQCESCNEAGTEGACVPVSGEPRGKRAKCVGDAAMCGGTCDGIDVSRCKYAPSSKDCGSTCATGTATEKKCDGSGECVSTTKTCGLYACDTAGCKTTCAVDTDCATGNRCAAPSCVPTGGAKCLDATSSQTADGKTVPCGAYKCDSTTGGCKQVCTDSATDCAAGFLCNATSKTCEPAPAVGGDDGGGCGCETGVGRATPASAWALLVILACAGTLGRRVRRTPAPCDRNP